MVRVVSVSLLAGLALVLAEPAGASVTIGQLGNGAGCSAGLNNDLLQESVGSGPSYTVPGIGTITSWSTMAAGGSGQSLTFKVFRKTAEPRTYKAVGHDGVETLTPDAVNSFPVRIPVQTGDVLGLNILSATPTNCLFPAVTAADAEDFYSPGLNDNQEAAFMGPAQVKIDVAAVFEPSNAIAVGTSTLNRKKGTATLNLTLPNPGDLRASGKGVKAASATTSKAVSAGRAQLLIKATGRKRKALNSNHRVKLTVHIIYTPANGSPSTTPVNVKLRKR